MKINIMIEFQDGPWGGGNQFLKALREFFKKKSVYEDEPILADFVLFNSHQNIKDIIKFKNKFPEKILVHRVDGPMAYRGKMGEKLDKRIFKINSIIADGTVFQSEWSRKENYNNGMKKRKFEAVIQNAPDPDIFFSSKQKNPKNNIVRLVATSWSNNPNKGFDIYHYLDENLNFNNYEMTFIGRTDKPFKNIKTLTPLPSKDLAKQLRKHDIFVFASKIEACSNSLLEALHCGLPAIVRNISSNPEVLGDNGVLFEPQNIIEKIDQVSNNLKKFKNSFSLSTINEIGEQFINFFTTINRNYESTKISRDNLTFVERVKLIRELF